MQKYFDEHMNILLLRNNVWHAFGQADYASGKSNVCNWDSKAQELND